MASISLYAKNVNTFPFRWLGSAFILAWMWLVLFPNPSGGFPPVARLAFLAGTALSLAFEFLASDALRFAWRRMSWSFSCLLLSLLTFVLCVSLVWPMVGLPAFVLPVLMIAAGFACCAMLLDWIGFHTKLKTDAMTVVILLSLMVSALVFCLIWGLRPAWWGAAWLALPLFSMIAYRLNASSGRSSRSDGASAALAAGGFLTMRRGEMLSRMAFLTVSSFAGGYVYEISAETVDEHGAFALAGVAAVNLVTIFSLWLLFSRKRGSTALQYAVVGILMACAASFFVGCGELAIAFPVFAGMLMSLLIFLAVVMCIDMASTFGVPLHRSCGTILLSALVAFGLGAAANLPILAFGMAEFGRIVSVFLVAGSALFLLVILLARNPTWVAYEMAEERVDNPEHLVIGDIGPKIPAMFRELGIDDAVASGVSSEESGEDMRRWKSRVEDIAEEFDLSPRQIEVFTYLTRGRNADYIANKLVVSPNTVRTHIASIYRKIGIHTQQELLDFFYGE